jgi:hypothetical protein
MTDPTAALVVARDALAEISFLRADLNDFLLHVVDRCKGDPGWDAVQLNAEALIKRIGFIDAAISTIEAAIAQQPKDSGVPAAPSRSLVAGLPTIAHATCPVLSAWRPIETAPKDGTLFLCWVSAVQYGESDEGQQYQIDVSQADFCQWQAFEEAPDGGWFEPCCGHISDQQAVTHWMPLPPAPTAPPAVPEQEQEIRSAFAAYDTAGKGPPGSFVPARIALLDVLGRIDSIRGLLSTIDVLRSAVPEQDAIDAERPEDLGDASGPGSVVASLPSIPIAAHNVHHAEAAPAHCRGNRKETMSPEQVARVAHEVNRAYCQALGDDSQPAWEDAPQWQRDSAMLGVKLHTENPDAGPQASHESWMAQKVAEGWVYGPEKRPDLKQHHCIVPFDQLPREQQAKDYLFRGVVHALLG